MLENVKRELEKIMSVYDKNEGVLKIKKEAEKESEKNFNDAFEELKHKVIWPAVVEFGNELTRYGHDFKISEEQAYIDAIANYHPASITFSIFPASLPPNNRTVESAPYVRFVADPYAKMVSIVVCTMMPGLGGVLGEHGRYEVPKVTAEVVENEIIEVLKHTPIFHK